MIVQATTDHAHIAATLAFQLWPHQTVQQFEEEMLQLIQQEDAAVFLAYHEQRAIGFAQCQLRQDYVEGTSTSPVGYLEGLYVEPTFRKVGYARQLITQCEQWAKRHHCSEFASDCELGNEVSELMHQKLGFTEANRIICFTKKL